jgi:hypothetical protein
MIFLRFISGNDRIVAVFESKLQRLGKTRAAIFTDNKAVDDNFDVVRYRIIQFRRLFEIEKLTINADAKET